MMHLSQTFAYPVILIGCPKLLWSKIRRNTRKKELGFAHAVLFHVLFSLCQLLAQQEVSHVLVDSCIFRPGANKNAN